MRNVAVAAIALAVFACNSAELDPESDVDDSEAKADGESFPLGTYVRNGDAPGDFDRIVIAQGRESTDRVLNAQPHQCEGTRCYEAPINGSFKFTRYQDKRYLRILLPNGDLYDRYEYKMTASRDLRLRLVNTTRWQTLVRDRDGWCGETVEAVAAEELCAMQGIPQPRCPGSWACEEASCKYVEQCEMGPDRAECTDYEGAIDDCQGTHGLELDECVEMLGGAEVQAVLDGCCAADDSWFFCP